MNGTQPLRESQFPFEKAVGSWVREEGVVSTDNISRHLHASLMRQSVLLKLDNTVVAIKQSGSGWLVEARDGTEVFDAVVLDTYGGATGRSQIFEHRPGGVR